MKLELNLTKSAQTLQLNLSKALGIIPKVDVSFVLDVTGSFDDEHRSGVTNDLLLRLTPWAMVLDPDRQIDVFTFGEEAEGSHHVGTITPEQVPGFVKKRIIEQVPGYGSRTDYSYVIELVLKKFGWLAEVVKKGWFGGGGSSAAAKPQKPTLVIFITDGDNRDKDRTRRVLRESEQRKDGVYYLFVGVSNQGSEFPFLESIGDEFGNTGYVAIKDLHAFVEQTDEELNKALLGDELLDWLKPKPATATATV